MKETLDAILERQYQTMVEVIGKERKLERAAVERIIDEALYASDHAKAARLVDEVGSFEAFRDGVAKPAWTKLELDDKAATDNKLATMFALARFVGAMPP